MQHRKRKLRPCGQKPLGEPLSKPCVIFVRLMYVHSCSTVPIATHPPIQSIVCQSLPFAVKGSSWKAGNIWRSCCNLRPGKMPDRIHGVMSKASKTLFSVSTTPLLTTTSGTTLRRILQQRSTLSSQNRGTEFRPEWWEEFLSLYDALEYRLWSSIPNVMASRSSLLQCLIANIQIRRHYSPGISSFFPSYTFSFVSTVYLTTAEGFEVIPYRSSSSLNHRLESQNDILERLEVF